MMAAAQSILIRMGRMILTGLTLIGVIVLALVQAQEQPGLVVEEVVADSAAAKAGLKVGDRVLSYDGQPLPSPAALQAAEENTFGKEEVVLQVRRSEETLTLTAPPGKLERVMNFKSSAQQIV